MSDWGKKGLEKFTKKFKMPLIQTNAECCFVIKIGTEVFNPLHGYIAMMAYIHDLRIIVTVAGLLPWSTFSFFSTSGMCILQFR